MKKLATLAVIVSLWSVLLVHAAVLAEAAEGHC